ncbi:hypothetical protein CEXT_356621, partial [Caerostris extrusa]
MRAWTPSRVSQIFEVATDNK